MMDEQEDERLPVVPLGDKKLRACLVTGLVKTEEQVLPCHPPRLRAEVTHAHSPCLLSGCATATTTFRAWNWSGTARRCSSAPPPILTGAPSPLGVRSCPATDADAQRMPVGRMAAMMKPSESWVARWQAIGALPARAPSTAVGARLTLCLPRRKLCTWLLRSPCEGNAAQRARRNPRGQR